MFFDSFSPAQLKAQYSRNLTSLQTMLNKAQTTGKKVGGYTAEQLAGHVANVESKIAAL